MNEVIFFQPSEEGVAYSEKEEDMDISMEYIRVTQDGEMEFIYKGEIK